MRSFGNIGSRYAMLVNLDCKVEPKVFEGYLDKPIIRLGAGSNPACRCRSRKTTARHYLLP